MHLTPNIFWDPSENLIYIAYKHSKYVLNVHSLKLLWPAAPESSFGPLKLEIGQKSPKFRWNSKSTMYPIIVKVWQESEVFINGSQNPSRPGSRFWRNLKLPWKSDAHEGQMHNPFHIPCISYAFVLQIKCISRLSSAHFPAYHC